MEPLAEPRDGFAAAGKKMRWQAPAVHSGRKKLEPRDGFAAAEKKMRWQAPAVHSWKKKAEPRDGFAAAGKKTRSRVTALHKRKKKTRRFEGALARRALAGSVAGNIAGEAHFDKSPIIVRMRSVTTFRSASISARSRGGLNT